MNLNWRTAKSYADTEQLPNEKSKVKDGMMYKEKWGEIVSDWLEEDRKMKKKDRRTNKGILIQLKDLGFPGSYRTLCHYIQEIRGVQLDPLSPSSNFERLEHPPGEAQVDFGIMSAVEAN